MLDAPEAADQTSSSRIRVLPARGFTPRPWLNGQGTTKDILQGPDPDEWHWRLSVATSAGDAPFSHFEGIDRQLVLLDGAGLDLHFDDDEIIRLRAPLESALFTGERGVTGRPVDGPTTQLNAMWRRGHVDAQVVTSHLHGTVTIDLDPTSTVIVFVAHGTVAIGPDSLELAAGDVALIYPGHPTAPLLLAGDAHLVTATFRPRT